MTRLKLFVFLAFAMIGMLFLKPPGLGAADLSQFKLGDIITDAVFFNGNSMSTQQVQYFLNSKVATCDTNGEKTYTGSSYAPDYDGDGRIERWERGKYTGNPKPYTCLKNYSQSTPSMTGVSGLCGNLAAKTSSTAAAIIKDVSSACGVSPKVLIVLLQKEQGLVTDDWPWAGQYTKATGFGCPDTAACDPAYKGFFYQVYSAAYQFKKYAANADNYNYVAGQNNSIYLHPGPYDSANHKYYGNACYDSNGRIVYGSKCTATKRGEAPDITYCGYKTVYIANQATAGLYNYTPYVPNQASLNAGYGTGDKCSSYGNRNFYSYFVDWFGSTQIKLGYADLVSPRWMQTRTDTQKHNVYTGESIDPVIPAGTKIYFPDKVGFNGLTYLRTRNDESYGYDKGILLSDLEEVPVVYQTMSLPRWMSLTARVSKYDPITESRASNPIPEGWKIYFKSKFEIGGKVYLRTEHDESAGLKTAILLSDLEDTEVSYQDFQTPRWMRAKGDTKSVNLRDTLDTTSGALNSGTDAYMRYKLDINGVVFGTTSLPDTGEYCGYPLSSLAEINLDFKPMVKPRWMRVYAPSVKVNPVTNVAYGNQIAQDTLIYFTSKLVIDNKVFLQTRHDYDGDIKLALPLDALTDFVPTYQPMQIPRHLVTKMDLRKQEPTTETAIDSLIKKGSSIEFSDKIDINGITYLRTKHDSSYGYSKVIPLSKLSEL